jgi:hypothetical protein
MILKNGESGRVVVSVERSGLSGPRFAAMAGLKYQTIAT